VKARDRDGGQGSRRPRPALGCSAIVEWTYATLWA
jgi:hypothetical protein